MRICYVATTTHISADISDGIGATTHVFELGQSFSRMGHRTFIVSERKTADETQEENIGSCTVLRLSRRIPVKFRKSKSLLARVLRPFKFLSIIKMGLTIADIVRKKQIDIIFERSQSLGAGAIASLLTGKPLYLEVIDDQQSLLSLILAKAIFVYTSVIIPKVFRYKAVIVTAGVNPQVFRPRNTKKLYDIGFVGAFKSWEGLEDLVEAIKILVHKKTHVTCLLIGGGERFFAIKEKIREYKLEKYIRLTGKVPIGSVAPLLNQAKIGIAPYNLAHAMSAGKFSKHGFYYWPLKIAEYLSCGLPVLASDYPLISTILKTPRFGHVFPPGNVPSLAAAIETMLGSLQKWNAKNLCSYVSQYSWDRVASDMLDVIDRAG